MKISTILFITFLFTINCTSEFLNLTPSDKDIDASLIELNKEPVTEGVFATMATQLSTEGGFERVLSLLHQLVADGKDQLHRITKTWRGVHARCTVSKIKLQGRQEFFDSHLSHARRNLEYRTNNNNESRGALDSYGKAIKVYRDLLKAEIARHISIEKHFHNMDKASNAGIKWVDTCLEAVRNWTPKAAALVQTMMRGLVNAYMQVSELRSIEQPIELLERSGNDGKVRKRLEEWLLMLKARLLAARAHYHLGKGRKAAMALIETTLGSLIKSLEGASKSVSGHIAANNSSIKANQDSIKLLSKLSHENKGLIKANHAYCQNERNNFHRNDKRIREEIKLFREIVKYFRDHYGRIHQFIRNKYNH